MSLDIVRISLDIVRITLDIAQFPSGIGHPPLDNAAGSSVFASRTSDTAAWIRAF